VAVGAGGRVTSDAVNTFPTAVAVGKALMTLIEELVEVEDEELERLTLLLDEDTAGFDEATTGFDEDVVGLTELLMILLELEILEEETVGFNTVELETLVDEDDEICLVDEEDVIFLVEEEDEIFLVDEEGLAVDLTELVTRAGVAVTALQTWDTTGAGSAAKGLPLRVGLELVRQVSVVRFSETHALNQNLQKGKG